MGLYDDVNDALGRDTIARSAATNGQQVLGRLGAEAVGAGRATVNAGRQAFGDTGYRARMQPDIPAEDVAAYATLPQAAYSNEGRGATRGDISYPAPNASSAAGSGTVPQMARSLAQDSQQRFAPPQRGRDADGVITAQSVKDLYAKDGGLSGMQSGQYFGTTDLAGQNERMVKALGYAGIDDFNSRSGAAAAPPAGWAPGILHSAQNDADAAWNNRMDMRSMFDQMERTGTRTGRAAAGQMLNELVRNQGQQQLQDNRLGYEMPRDMAREATQRRGQDMQLAATGLQGRNQLAAEQMRGQNQLATTGLQGQWQGRNQAAMDDRRFDNDRALKGDEYEYRRNDPLYQGQARQANEVAGYYGVQKENYAQSQANRLESTRQKNKADYIAKESRNGLLPPEQIEANADKLFPQPLHTQDPAVLRKLMAEYNPGYADGGVVAPAGESRAQRMLREMNEKYGTGTKSTEPPPAPAGLPAPATPAPQPTAVQNPAGWAEGVATGGLRRRMEGFAFGGAVPGGRAVAQAVAGRQVFGQSDGSGEDDALPAVVDGERPAALTSGEFVWPVKAVQFYGMDRLNKMLAAAEKGMAGKDEQA